MVVDQDYRGSVIVALHNDTDELMSIEAKERIAQLIVMPYISVDFTVVDELSDTERGGSGFGSTGAR
jgi:dUTP pyrophosphatase